MSHLVISETTGAFDDFNVEATTGDDFSNPMFKASIETASINTKLAMLDDHLKAEDFFDVKKYPKITFTTNSFEKTEGKKFKVKGLLTIKDVAKEVTFNGNLNGVVDTKYGKKAGLKLTTTIDRATFGVGEKGGSVGDEVEVTINLEMNQAK